MTVLRHYRHKAMLLAFALLLLFPSLAIRAGLLPLELRFEALLIVSGLCIAMTALAGYSRAQLGLSAPWITRHWIGCGAMTLLLAGCVMLERPLLDATRAQPDWISFLPFYVLVSSPLQELVCRAIPKLITDELRMSGHKYVLFSAAVFSLMHYGYGDPLLLANTFVAGLLWAAAYQLTRNLWPLMASHAAVGAFAFWLGVA